MFIVRWFFLSVLLCLTSSIAGAATVAKTSFYHNFTDTRFVTHHNAAFEPQDYLGKVVLFNFIYTKCSQVCPLQTRQLVEVYRALPKAYQDKVVFVSISLDSFFDKPSVLKRYAHSANADFDQWLFLSSRYEDIKTLQDKLFLFGNPANPKHPKVKLEQLKTTQKEKVLSNHMAILWVVDAQGRLIQRYAASPVDTKRVTKELKQLVDMAK